MRRPSRLRIDTRQNRVDLHSNVDHAEVRLALPSSHERLNSSYSPYMWSVYQRSLDGEARMNNYAEASHCRPHRLSAHSELT